MGYHILHLLSPNLRVRLKLDQLHIGDRDTGEERAVPLADVAIIVCAAPDAQFSAASLRRMTELGVLLIVCNERFEPCSLVHPYYRGTNTELLRRQVEWTSEWKETHWRQIITAKIRNQATVLADLSRANRVLNEIAERCATGPREESAGEPDAAPRPSLASITASRRAFFLSRDATACESRAARHYWRYLLPRLGEEKRREPGTRIGVNGLLDYGYAILRTATLRSLAAHGFIAALGLHHAARAGSFALADDLMEPLRPFADRALRSHLATHPPEITAWMPRAAAVLTESMPAGRPRVRLLHAIDLYVQSFADATLRRSSRSLRIPMLA